MKGKLQNWKRTSTILASTVAVVLMSAAAAQDRGPLSLPDGAIVDPDGLTVAKCINSGGTTPKKFNVCVTTHGNISIETAGGIIMPFNYEGYAVCSSLGTHGWDLGSAESAWGTTSFSLPSATTVLVSRTTADGRIKLDMKISRDTGEYDATIQTTVTNVGATTLNSVLLTRYAGGGGPGFVVPAPGGIWARSLFSNFVKENTSSAIALKGISTGTSGITHATYNNYDLPIDTVWQPQNCVSTATLQPETGNSGSGFGSFTVLRSVYDFGNLGPGAKKTVKQVYSRQ